MTCVCGASSRPQAAPRRPPTGLTPPLPLCHLPPLQRAYSLLRNWGTRFVVTEYAPVHDRPAERERRDALVRVAAEGGDMASVPPFDADLYLSGRVRRVMRQNRFEVFQVLGEDGTPNW